MTDPASAPESPTPTPATGRLLGAADIRRIAAEGQQRGQISDSMTANEIAKIYALCERALIYDWCLSEGDYSLLQYGKTMMPMFFREFRVEKVNFV